MVELPHWFFLEMPRLIIRAGLGYLSQAYHGFSIPLLARTILAPWKRDSLPPEGHALDQLVRVLLDNLVSRFIGAVIRLSTLGAGGLVTVVVGAVFVSVFLLWLSFPFVSVVLIGLGIQQLVGGG